MPGSVPRPCRHARDGGIRVKRQPARIGRDHVALRSSSGSARADSVMFMTVLWPELMVLPGLTLGFLGSFQDADEGAPVYPGGAAASRTCALGRSLSCCA